VLRELCAGEASVAVLGCEFLACLPYLFVGSAVARRKPA